MFFIYSADLFLLNKQVKKVIVKIESSNEEVEVNTYSWIEDDIQKIMDDILTTSFFVEQKIIVIKDAYFLTEKKKEASWVNNDTKFITSLLNHSLIPNIVIFTLNEEKLSTRLKLTKDFTNQVKMIKVEELNQDQIIDYVLKKASNSNHEMSPKDAKFFVESLPTDMMIINNELNKLLNLKQEKIDQEVINNNVSHYFESDAYKLSEYFQTNQIDKFINEFHNYLALSNDLIRLIYLLNTNLTFTRDCALLKDSGKSEKTIAELLNAHPYRIKKAIEQNNLTIKQLNDKILMLYNLNKLVINGLVDPALYAELELIKNMSRR